MEDTVIPIGDHNTHNGKQEFKTTHNGRHEEFTPHYRKQVTMITCSPKMENIVTWSDEDNSVVCWHISDNQKELEPKHKISLKNNENFINYDENKVYSKYIESRYSKNFGDIKNWFTVSDDKFVSMPIEKIDLKIKYITRIKIGIFNFISGENLLLILPHSEIIVETLAFLDGNKLIMISKDPLYRIYNFTRKDDEFIHKSTIKMESYDEKIFISNGKLFLYHEKLGSITKWDINTSKFEAHFLFDNSFSVDNMKLSDDGVLLFVYGKKIVDNLREEPYPCISIYSADHGIRFTTYKYNKTVIIDAVYLIARDIGARLLVVYHKSYKINKDNYRFSICDPFAQYSPDKLYVKIKDLFKDFDVEFDNSFENNFENKYIIKYDKIVGFNYSGTLVIKDLIKDLIKDTGPNWISYLRNTLKDSDSIYMSSISEQIIGLINKEATFAIDKKPQYSKHLVTWTFEHKNIYEKKNDKINDKINVKPHIFLTAKFKNDETKSDTIQIVPAIYINAGNDDKKFVEECDCLDNDDLVMVTALGVLIWTFNTKVNKIELNYFWDDERNSWEWNKIKVIKLFYEIDEENFDEKKFDIKKLKKTSYFLPPSSYISMIRYNHAFIQPIL
ncbi:hypothetical protein C2G38_910415 [Gigaspora rosea]|uniref:Uncharacterized protein n=1 Tax=Gigaspora rosea TaxID=44941 RepID=A0A397VPZ3_9GLOM|nr:hypothetical protein C2G38_910415 [Gigaspora rosea]